MKFYFESRNKAGELKEGTIEAADKESAIGILQENELFPTSIVAESSGGSLERTLHKYYERVNAKELMIFFRQLAILIETRVPIVTSLIAISEQTTNKFLGRVIQEVVNDVEEGLSFSKALEKHKDVFSDLAINIIRAGETSGNLRKSVDYVADNIERNYALTSRVRGAMMYPAIVMIVFFIIGFLTVSFILPRLTEIIKGLNAEVPWYTKMVIGVGDFMAAYWWAVLIIILGFLGGIAYYLNTKEGRKEWDLIKIKMPIVGSVFQGVYISRFSENLGVLLAGGIPILRAITITSSVIGNSVYEAILLRAAEEVKVGGNMSRIFKKNVFIPPAVTHMVKIGEETGQLETVLGHIAKFYDQEVEIKTKNLSTLIEPVLIIIIGIAVAFMAIAILLPIYNVANQIN